MSSSSLHRMSSSAAAQSMSRQPKLGCFPAQSSCFELELKGARSHGISSSLRRLCSPREMWGWRGMTGVCPWPVSAMTSLICKGWGGIPWSWMFLILFPFSHAQLLPSLTHLCGDGKGMGRNARCCWHRASGSCWRFCCLWSGLAGSQESIPCSVCPCNSL